MQGLLITGTDTGVGKTFVTCGIVRALRQRGVRVGAYKPVCSGAESGTDGKQRWPDIEALADALGPGVPSQQICPQRFSAPLAPPAAAAREHRTVDERLLLEGVNAWRATTDLLLIEGVGGLLCPLNQSLTIADYAGRLAAPLVVVAALRLGVINHTLLTLEVARSRNLTVAGVLLNETGPDDGSNASSIAEITARGGVDVLGVLPFAGRESLPPSADDPACRLRRPDILSRIDWSGLGAELLHV